MATSHWNQMLRRVWRYERGNQNMYIKEEQTTQWPKEKWQTTIFKTCIWTLLTTVYNWNNANVEVNDQLINQSINPVRV